MSSRYYYSATLLDFISASANQIMGQLSTNNAFNLTQEQRNAWIAQTPILKEHLSSLTEGHVFFEYTIPRMGKRCDVILLHKDNIYVIEFKVGATHYNKADSRQAIDYALDLKNFHKQSHNQKIIPILIATNADEVSNLLVFEEDQVSNCQFTAGASLGNIILRTSTSGPSISALDWSNSSYQPTPTIIEAAKALFLNHSVADISRNDASAKNLSSTCACIKEIIDNAQNKHTKSICFVTGVPGSGKTLAGLNIATTIMDSTKKKHSTFLSGNGPLVEVLQRALSLDKKERDGGTIKEAERETKTFIQNIHHFRDNYLIDPNAPSDQVVIFDEAQRAWTKEKASKFMRQKKQISDFNQSEPEFLVNVMGRHRDWCVIIALIGGGQEINDGEAGLPEWFRAINAIDDNWTTYYSPMIDSSEYTLNSNINKTLPSQAIKKDDLHLSVSLRSFRAENLSNFINYVISNNPKEANDLSTRSLKNFPIFLTRDLELAKKWLRKKKRGSERCGIVASADAKRLAPHGIQMKLKIEPAHWFLGDSNDIRSSDFLELAASQYDIQGLELDWTIVAWDADLRHSGSYWEHYSFKGSKWQKIHKDINQLYLRNAYRVILTRARQGMVLFIPEGDACDATRPPSFYDPIVEYLKRCGIQELK